MNELSGVHALLQSASRSYSVPCDADVGVSCSYDKPSATEHVSLHGVLVKQVSNSDKPAFSMHRAYACWWMSWEPLDVDVKIPTICDRLAFINSMICDFTKCCHDLYCDCLLYQQYGCFSVCSALLSGIWFRRIFSDISDTGKLSVNMHEWGFSIVCPDLIC